ncbi:MAG: bacitracin ABC transporter permease [Halieaceae bacterium]|jgi:KDO2-lipid IV(A) lauroyltransferase|nr:bacitracin ABC transporter permease [Halieaceae bacterium]
MKQRLAPHAANLLLGVSAALSLRYARGIGRFLGSFAWWSNSKWRRITERNVALAYPQLNKRQSRALCREVLSEAGMLAFEMGHVWRKPWSETQKYILEVEGAALVYAAKAEGRGVIVLGPHVGNWEVLGLHLSTLGDLVALFEPPRINTLEPLIRSARERAGGVLVPTTPRGLAQLVRNVRAGGISGILPDQVPNDVAGGLDALFMGHSAFTATLAPNLIKRSGAIALTGAAYRIPGGFKVCYRSVSDLVYSDDLNVAVNAVNKEVEKVIADWGGQYIWQYKRFRSPSPGASDHYRNL